MKMNFSLIGAVFALAPLAAMAAPVLTTGTPADSLLSTPTSASPNLHGIAINFDSLTPNSALSPTAFAAQGVSNISSPDGLMAIPFSTQTSPNEIFDTSSDGSANVTINLSLGTSAIGIGLADSDGVTIMLEALNSTGGVLGSAFTVTLPSATVNPFNGYFVISDTSADIFGLKILQSTGNANFSGLAFDDLQVATPEPSTSILVIGGGALLGVIRLRRRKLS